MNILERVIKNFRRIFCSTQSFISLLVVHSYIWFCLNINPTRLFEVNNIVINLSSVLLGFLITSIAILTAIMDRKLIANMRKTGHFKNLMTEAFIASGLLLCLIIMGVINLFISESYLYCTMGILIYFLSLSFLYVLVLGRIFYKVIIIV
ncbi:MULTISPECIES: hypothetical protein [Entomomonas]|uniref:Uncharacterized protein n=1 Tax=Entomomonas asaccharolytica TaxID=2785331 RepID=A0A974NE64_9GAMM|nr:MULTISPECIES: hypothetical protein [Entomomonas]QQP85018.1 hypothetical protein JHT90_11555 [Entomomonas asaccharolytica]UYZ85323.1 hypothetical protein MTZ49_07190 [Entomomonas sp. E2T0]